MLFPRHPWFCEGFHWVHGIIIKLLILAVRSYLIFQWRHFFMIGRWTSIALCRYGGWIVLWRNCKILKSGFQKRSAFASRLSNTLVTEERRTRFGIKGRTGRTVDPASGGISSPRSPPSKSQLATTSLLCLHAHPNPPKSPRALLTRSTGSKNGAVFVQS